MKGSLSLLTVIINSTTQLFLIRWRFLAAVILKRYHILDSNKKGST